MTFAANDNGRNASTSLNSAAVGSYLYNGFEQRAQKTAGAATTQFVYDESGHLLEEADGSGTVQKEYIWLDDMPVAMVDSTGASPVLYYIHTDQIGTPQKLTDGSMNLVWDGVLDPFGNPASGASLALTNLRFPGQYADGESGLNQNWNRDFDPTIGRYLQADISGVLLSSNLYIYADANPLNMIDSLGLYTLKPGGPVPVAVPSAAMQALLLCIEAKTGADLVITSTSEPVKEHPAGTPHGRGVAADIRYPAKSGDAAKILCAANDCGAGFALDEKSIRQRTRTTHTFTFRYPKAQRAVAAIY